MVRFKIVLVFPIRYSLVLNSQNNTVRISRDLGRWKIRFRYPPRLQDFYFEDGSSELLRFVSSSIQALTRSHFDKSKAIEDIFLQSRKYLCSKCFTAEKLSQIAKKES